MYAMQGQFAVFIGISISQAFNIMRSAFVLFVAAIIVFGGEHSLFATPPIIPGRGKNTIDTVQRGETMYAIAVKHGVNMYDIKTLNGLANYDLKVGQILKIPAGGTPIEPPPDDGSKKTVHLVRSGETIGALARRYKTTVQEIKTLNGMAANYIYRNQRLIVAKNTSALSGSQGVGENAWVRADKYSAESKKQLNIPDSAPSANKIEKQTKQDTDSDDKTTPNSSPAITSMQPMKSMESAEKPPSTSEPVSVSTAPTAESESNFEDTNATAISSEDSNANSSNSNAVTDTKETVQASAPQRANSDAASAAPANAVQSQEPNTGPAKIPTDRSENIHIVKEDETLEAIADNYGVTERDLRNWNFLLDGDITVGQGIIVDTLANSAVVKKDGAALKLSEVRQAPPIKDTSTATTLPMESRDTAKTHTPPPDASAITERREPAPSANRPVGSAATPPDVSPVEEVKPEPGDIVHTVQRGETLSAIARRYKVYVADLKRWNKLQNNAVRAMQKLIVKKAVQQEQPHDSDTTVHTVRAGETISSIADTYGLSVNELKTLNNLKSNSVYSGQKLKIK